MKKILSIPLIFTVLLSLFPLLPSRAANMPTSEQVSTANAFYNTVKDNVCSLDNILSQVNDPQNYIYFNSLYFGSNGRAYIKTYFCLLDESSEYDPTVELSDNDTLYTVSCDTSQALHVWTKLAIFSSDHSVIASSAAASYDSSSGVHTTSFYIDTTTSYCDLFDRYETECLVGDVIVCLDGSILGSGLDIDVSFSPSLSGDVTREVTSFVFSPWNAPDLSGSDPASINVSESDTRTSISETFTMTVKNNSRVGAELLFAIVPKGESIHFYGSYSSTPTACSYVYDYSTNPIFVWWSQDWNYFYDSLIPDSITRVDHHLSDSVSSYFSCSEQLSNIPWHFIEKKSTWYHDFSWSQINLKEDSEYSVLVYAVECNYGKASRQCIYPDMDYYVDYSSIELVYSSDFRLVNGYIYNPNDDSFNNIPVGIPSDIVNMGWSSVGYKDPLTGETVIKSRSFNDYADNLNTIRRNAGDEVFIQWTPPSISSNSDYGGLLDNTSNVFSFFTAVFNYFPSGFITIFTIGFWSIIILSIVRRLH